MLAFLFYSGCFLALLVIGCVLERTVPGAGAGLFYTSTPTADEQQERADVAKARRVEAERRERGAA